MSGQKAGGESEVKKATKETQQLVDSVRTAAETQAGQTFDKFEATSFKTQYILGMNHFVKVDIGGDKYVHLPIFESLPCGGQPPELTGIQLNKTADDPIQ